MNLGELFGDLFDRMDKTLTSEQQAELIKGIKAKVDAIADKLDKQDDQDADKANLHPKQVNL
jgi:hypothetical protein